MVGKKKTKWLTAPNRIIVSIKSQGIIRRPVSQSIDRTGQKDVFYPTDEQTGHKQRLKYSPPNWVVAWTLKVTGTVFPPPPPPPPLLPEQLVGTVSPLAPQLPLAATTPFLAPCTVNKEA
jgi:hypothetical protein